MRLTVVVATVAAIVALSPASVSADVTKRDRAGDVKLRGLTAKERSALDITKIHAATNTRGVIVTATLRGDLEKALGRGHLKKAAAALILRPAERGAPPRVVVVSGAGKRRRVASDLARSTPYAAVVDGRELTLIALGVDPSKLARVEVATVPSLGSRSRGARAAGVASGLFKRLDRSFSADHLALLDHRSISELFGPLGEKDCDDLFYLKAILEIYTISRSGGRIAEAVRADLTAELVDVKEEIRRRPCDTSPGQPTLPPPAEPDPVAEARTEWVFFQGTPELKVTVKIRRRAAAKVRAAASDNPVDAVRFTAPGGRQITNSNCPAPLANREVSGSTLTCSGGSLPLGQSYEAFMQTSPQPEHGMGVEVSARQDGQFTPPAQAPGPDRSCGFIFNPVIVLWQCSAAHDSVRFDFNRPVQKTSVDDPCLADPGDNSVINCPGRPAFSSEAFSIDDPCPGTTFVAQTTFAPGDVQAFPEKACQG
jgi:hypothetical protein